MFYANYAYAGARIAGGMGVYPPGPPTPPGPPIPPIEKLGPPIKTPRPFQGICATVHMLDLYLK